MSDGIKREAPTVVDVSRRARISAVTPTTLPSDRFHDEGEIAHGGASTVHRIFDKTLLRRSAMKVLAPQLRPFAEDRQRFIEEAQITGQLDHPNVVPIHELGLTGGGSLYFTMKLVEGHTLAEMLSTRHGELRRFDWVAAFLEILIKVCDAIAFAHSRGVVHRDLKPGNIMVGTYGQVYVMDWGLARLTDGHSDVEIARDRQVSIDHEGDPLGTYAYMPPEQALGHHLATDERSDIFALGATLYEILTGHAPYEEPDELEQLAAACSGIIRPPEHFATTARLPRALGKIAMRAMARDPAERHPTATALREDLAAQMRGGADLPHRTFAAGELLVQEGELGDAAYIIVEGTCRAFKTIDGQVVELRRMGPGEVFGETAILSSQPRTASVEALEPLTVQIVTPEELEEGVGVHTGLGRFVRTLAERFREVDERLITLENNLVRRDSDP
jgi:eukaryotic-like serine/threonine-protein kinase